MSSPGLLPNPDMTTFASNMTPLAAFSWEEEEEEEEEEEKAICPEDRARFQ